MQLAKAWHACITWQILMRLAADPRSKQTAQVEPFIFKKMIAAIRGLLQLMLAAKMFSVTGFLLSKGQA